MRVVNMEDLRICDKPRDISMCTSFRSWFGYGPRAEVGVVLFLVGTCLRTCALLGWCILYNSGSPRQHSVPLFRTNFYERLHGWGVICKRGRNNQSIRFRLTGSQPCAAGATRPCCHSGIVKIRNRAVVSVVRIDRWGQSDCHMPAASKPVLCYWPLPIEMYIVSAL